MSAPDPIIVHTIRDERTLACPLCDFAVDVPPIPVTDDIGAALGMSGQTLALVHAEQSAKRASAQMREHLKRHDVVEWLTRTPELHPAEAIALTAALGPVMRGEAPGENTALMCVLALARLMGRHDWGNQ